MTRRGRGGDREQRPQLALGHRVAERGGRGERLGVRAPVGSERGDERVDDPRVEIPARAAAYLLERPRGLKRLSVGTVGGECVEGVAGQHDP